MTSDDTPYRLAVIGFGPRGLGATEALAKFAKGSGHAVHVDVFDASQAPGAGPNFAPDETPLCLLNVPVRDIDLPHATGGFDSFPDWLAPGNHPDRFPTRAELGRYFTARRDHLCANLPDRLILTFHDLAAWQAIPHGVFWAIETTQGAFGPYDEVLITVGQPETAPDDQIAKWQDHASTSGAALAQVYPAHGLLDRAQGWAGKSVGLRGLGLSTLDALRLLTIGQGGEMRDGRYVASGGEPGLIVPFSLDGHPPVPKPETEEIDARFSPANAETEAFCTALTAALQSGPKDALHHVTRALVAPVARITGAPRGGVEAWLATECDTPGGQETRPPREALRAGLYEATGHAAPSVGYGVGQVWRKWQNDLRKLFNPSDCAADTALALNGFDEGLKRYSYGPPVSAARELLALCDAGIVTLAAADDPDIECDKNGWVLHGHGAAALHLDAMVDTVLAPPQLSRVTGGPVALLRDSGHLSAVDDSSGTHTRDDGQAVASDDTPVPGLYLLGRLALGSVIAADSIHDCFGAASHRWAEGVQDRARKRVTTQEPEPTHSA